MIDDIDPSDTFDADAAEWRQVPNEPPVGGGWPQGDGRLSGIDERFWSKVDIAGEDDCWEWTASVRSTGYGQLTIKGRNIAAHRYALGAIDSDLYVLHSCDNRRCVNPRHLRLGTQVDNMADARKRGRTRNQYTDATHCIHGHPFDEANTYYWRNRRRCRACGAIANRRYVGKKAPA